MINACRVETNFTSEFHDADNYGNYDVVHVLLENNADANAADKVRGATLQR